MIIRYKHDMHVLLWHISLLVKNDEKHNPNMFCTEDPEKFVRTEFKASAYYNPSHTHAHYPVFMRVLITFKGCSPVINGNNRIKFIFCRASCLCAVSGNLLLWPDFSVRSTWEDKEGKKKSSAVPFGHFCQQSSPSMT